MAYQNETPIAEISAVRRGREAPVEPPPRAELSLKPKKVETGSEQDSSRQKVANAIMAAEGLPPGRLVIEQDQAKKGFVYIILDPKTGEEVRRWPKEQWMSRARELGFTSGVVVDKKL